MPVQHGPTLRRPFGGGNACLARPLKRAIQDKLLNPLAQRLLAGDFKPGDTVKVGAGREDELEFAKG
jgi:ATP-dependent Clp protease ATP-binding subunit ClpA